MGLILSRTDLYYFILDRLLNPDNQQPLLRIYDEWLSGGKAGKRMNGNALEWNSW